MHFVIYFLVTFSHKSWPLTTDHFAGLHLNCLSFTNFCLLFFPLVFDPNRSPSHVSSSSLRWHRHTSRHRQPEGLGQAALASLHLVHEDHVVHGAHGDDARDPQGARLQQLRVRAARALHAAVRVGQPGPRRLRPVGDGGVQAPAALPQRRALQTDLGHVHRLQEHCLKDCQRAQTVSAEEQRGEMRLKGGGGWVKGVIARRKMML